MPLDVHESSEESRLRRIFAIAGTAAFLVLAPGVVAGYIPWAITRWQAHAPFPGYTAMRVVGVVLMAAGVPVLLECFARFALQGVGTPAPVLPTQHLVVKGFYRFVRNPMYVSALAVLFGQALFFWSIAVAIYAACVWLITHLFVVFYEEPTLLRTFGAEYETYREHVPRWIPRLRPWRGSEEKWARKL
jgi:protein-S-isoprenylcysteine O-methyltransferase Ste14